MMFRRAVQVLTRCAILLAAGSVSSAQPAADSSASGDGQGVLIHEVRSEFQSGPTRIKVLLPDQRREDERFPVIYLLPVEALEETRYGDGLQEVRKQDLHNKHRSIFVAPTFSLLPWYADHPTDLQIRQESYFLKQVLPLIEEKYPARKERDGRLLLGFSKSGWGAWSLLLRHPGVFGKAAAWDAPLTMSELGKYGTAPIFGTQANFESYRITDFVRQRHQELGNGSRLILMGHGNFADQTRTMHQLLEQLKVRHEYRDGPQRAHDWHSGWVAEAAQLLLRHPDGH